MEIELKHITVAELSKGYINSLEEGVVGFDGKLNIRPKYQREFVYNDKQKIAVIESITRDYPLNVMYWVDNEDGSYEVLDGQQRSLSVCEYITGSFSVNFKYFHNLEPEEKEQILNYKILVYFCKGTNREKLNWFETINIAGEKLTNQELLNAVYTGEWLTDAKKHFSKTNCAAWNIGKNYVKGSPIRQDFLETSLKWISKGNVADYMAKNQKKKNANELWLYFNNVITWIETIFPKYRKEMKGINWGNLYDEFKDAELDYKVLEKEIVSLLSNEDVTKKTGVYAYILTKNERYLSIRAFTEKQKREAYEKQKGICPVCGNHFKLEEMEADHIIPFSQGGKTVIENLQMLCKEDNRKKSNI